MHDGDHLPERGRKQFQALFESWGNTWRFQCAPHSLLFLLSVKIQRRSGFLCLAAFDKQPKKGFSCSTNMPMMQQDILHPINDKKRRQRRSEYAETPEFAPHGRFANLLARLMRLVEQPNALNARKFRRFEKRLGVPMRGVIQVLARRMQKIPILLNPSENVGIRKWNQIVEFCVEDRIFLREPERIFGVFRRFAGQADNEKERHVIADVTASAASSKNLGSLLMIMAFITINIGMANLLPLPALDGGRFFFLLIEAIRRKPINPKYEGYVHAIGFILLMLLMVVVTYNDIVRLIKT